MAYVQVQGRIVSFREGNTSSLKINGWKMKLLFGAKDLCSGANWLLVSGI